jgi:hypothetical protein
VTVHILHNTTISPPQKTTILAVRSIEASELHTEFIILVFLLFTLVISINKCEGYDLLNDMSRTYSTHGAKRTAYRILMGKPEGKKITRKT